MLSKSLSVAAIVIAYAFGPSTVSAQNSGKPFEEFMPGSCAQAPRRIDQLAARDFVDNTSYNPAKDSTSRLAADSVKICANAFGGSTNDTWQLLNFGRVQLILAADSLARDAAQRYLNTIGMSAADKRAWALYLITSDNVAARPARFVAAREALAELDKLGAPAGKARVLAHFIVARAAHRHFDEAMEFAEADATIAVWKTLPRPIGLQTSTQLAAAYTMKAEIALRSRGAAAAQAILDTAGRVVPAEAIFPSRNIANFRKLYSTLGKVGAPIEAQFWYGAASSGPKPARGRVTLLTTAAHGCRASCRERYKLLRRYGMRFSGRMDIIHLTRTFGFFSDSAPVAPTDEARFDSAYFLGRQRLPGALAVYDSKFDWLRDGRRRNRPSPQDTNYPVAVVVIIDKKGIVRYVSDGWDPILEEPLAKFIERVIAE